MNNNQATYDYGKCHICGEQMEARRINQDFWLKGKLTLLKYPPPGVSPQQRKKRKNTHRPPHLPNTKKNKRAHLNKKKKPFPFP